MDEVKREELLRSIEICQRIFAGTNLIHPDADEIRRAREAMGDTAFDAVLYWIAFFVRARGIEMSSTSLGNHESRAHADLEMLERLIGEVAAQKKATKR